MTWPFLLRGSKWNGTTLVLALLLPLGMLPATLALFQGQLSIVLQLLFTLVYLDLASGNDVRAGCWLACTSFKPQFLLPMLLALLVWKKWRAFQGFFPACGALLVLSIAVTGWHATLYYPGALLEFSRMAAASGGEHAESMPNVRGMLFTLFQSDFSGARLEASTGAASLLLVGAMLLLLKRHRHCTSLTFSLVILVSLAVSYHSYLHDDTLLLLPVFLAGVDCSRARPAIFRVAAAAVAFGLLFVPYAPSSLSVTAFQVSMLMLAWLLLLGWEIACGGQADDADGKCAAVQGFAV